MFNRTPYNRLMYNSSGGKQYGAAALSGKGVLTPKSARNRGLKTNLTSNAQSTLYAIRRIPAQTSLNGLADLDSNGIRAKLGSLNINGMATLVSKIGILKIGQSELFNDSIVLTQGYRLLYSWIVTDSGGFNRPLFNEGTFNQNFTSKTGIEPIEGKASLASASFKRSSSPANIIGVSSVSSDYGIIIFSTTSLKGEANTVLYGIRREPGSTLLKITGLTNLSAAKRVSGTTDLNNQITFSVKIFKKSTGKTLLNGNATINLISTKRISNRTFLIIDSDIKPHPVKIISTSTYLIGLVLLNSHSNYIAVSLADLRNDGVLLAVDPFLYRWITENINEIKWDSIEKSPTRWEQIELPATDWKRVIK